MKEFIIVKAEVGELLNKWETIYTEKLIQSALNTFREQNYLQAAKNNVFLHSPLLLLKSTYSNSCLILVKGTLPFCFSS